MSIEQRNLVTGVSDRARNRRSPRSLARILGCGILSCGFQGGRMINMFGCGRTKAPTSMRDRVYPLELNFRCNPTIQYSICTGSPCIPGRSASGSAPVVAIGCSICRTMVVRCPRVGVYKKTGHCGTKRTKNGCVSSFNYVVDPCQSRSSKPPLPGPKWLESKAAHRCQKACENISGYPSELNGRARTDLHPKKLCFGKDRQKNGAHIC